jgi:hypothetical protein
MQMSIIKTIRETLHCITVKFRIKFLLNIKKILFYFLKVSAYSDRYNQNDLLAIVKSLIEYHADLNIRNMAYNTPLRLGILKMFNLLVLPI